MYVHIYTYIYCIYIYPYDIYIYMLYIYTVEHTEYESQTWMCFPCCPNAIHENCNMTHSYVRHDTFICVL